MRPSSSRSHAWARLTFPCHRFHLVCSSASCSSAARSASRRASPLREWPRPVSCIVRWNQSTRCCECGRRYHCNWRKLLTVRQEHELLVVLQVLALEHLGQVSPRLRVMARDEAEALGGAVSWHRLAHDRDEVGLLVLSASE